MNVGEKWKLSSGDTVYEIEHISGDHRFLTLREDNGEMLTVDTYGLTSSYLERVEYPAIGSHWLTPNNKLITVLNIIEDRIRYYFGEAYCFTKVERSMGKSEFLRCMAEFKGKIDDYDISGNYAPTVTTVSVNVDNTYVVPTEDQIRDVVSDMFKRASGCYDCPPQKVEVSQPLWKRILRKLV